MKKIAIISFNHEESSLCLAKYIALRGIKVDYYYINKPYLKGYVPGFEFWRAKIHWGIQKLLPKDIPEINEYVKGCDVNFYLITYDTSRRYSYIGLDRLVLWASCKYIKTRDYDAVNIVGQNPEVERCHKYLRGENIIHTYHEIGTHYDNVKSTPSVDISIKDKSKVILHSISTYERYVDLPNTDKKNISIIPFGKFETCKLYDKETYINIPLDLSKPTFLFFGLIRPYKGLDLLASTMKLLSKYNERFNLIIAGSGSDENLPFFQTLSNCFVLNRYISNYEMVNLIKQCSAIVLPYHTASQTGIISTIALYSKPVIATNVGAFQEMIENRKNGIVVEKNNPDAFANAMKECFENLNLLKDLSFGMSMYGNGDKYDWNAIADKTISFFKT